MAEIKKPIPISFKLIVDIKKFEKDVKKLVSILEKNFNNVKNCPPININIMWGRDKDE